MRNVPTNIRELGGARMNGNSIFVFEVADLCIAHLGHLHHTLTDVHLGELGQIDVLLVPADGGYTMAHTLMVEVIEQIRPAVVIPMHYFSVFTLSGFLDLMRERYEVVIKDEPTITLSRANLPWRQVLCCRAAEAPRAASAQEGCRDHEEVGLETVLACDLEQRLDDTKRRPAAGRQADHGGWPDALAACEPVLVMTGRVALEVDTSDHPHPDPAAAPGRPEADHDAGGRGDADAEAEPRRDADQGARASASLAAADRERSGRKSITDLAEQEGVTDAYVCRLLPLTCLAPDIVEAILDGRQPKGLRLAEMLGNGPLGWSD